MSRPTREQARAQWAYARVGEVAEEARREAGLGKEYKALANGFGAFVLKNGLCAALAFAQRSGNEAARDRYLAHLAGAGVPGLEGTTGEHLFAAVRGLGVPAYRMATREILAVAAWLRRAAQALLADGGKAEGASDARRAP